MPITRAEIEDAVLAALKASPLRDACRRIDTYAGEFEAEIDQLSALAPAVFVVMGGGSFTPSGGTVMERGITFTVYVVARSLRGNNEARRDADAGSYAMLEIVEAALSGTTLGLDIDTVIPAGDAPVLNSSRLSVYSIDFQTGFEKTL